MTNTVPRYHSIGIDSISALAAQFKARNATMAIDTETTGLDPRVSKIVTVQFGTPHNAWILDCRPFYTLDPDMQSFWKSTLQKLVDSAPLVIGHNLKFDAQMLWHYFGVTFHSRVADTMLQELIIHGIGQSGAESGGMSVSMLATAARYELSVSKEAQSWWIGLDAREDWNGCFPESQLAYCAQDVFIPHALHKEQVVLLEQHSLQVTADLENATLQAIARMEYDGCYIDQGRWQAIITLKSSQRDALEQEISQVLSPPLQAMRDTLFEEATWKLCAWQEALDLFTQGIRLTWEQGNTGTNWGTYKSRTLATWRATNPRPETPRLDRGPINLRSTTQLKAALAEMGVCVVSTDSAHLTPFAKEIPLIGKICAWKALEKFVGSFGESILSKIGVDGRIHPHYYQIGAATGRMSCSNPNWQQIPSHEPDDTSVRRCVVAEQGCVLLTADFSNIEVRILAEMSQDENLLSFFQTGGDLHCTTARLMFGLDATDEHLKGSKALPAVELHPGLSYRSVAKTINFGLMYGMSPVRLARTLGIEKESAEDLFERYFAAYPGVQRWLTSVSAQALLDGYSSTLGGRKRFYPRLAKPQYDAESMEWPHFLEVRAHWQQLRGSYERQAKNAPIQGTSADITKFALASLYRRMPDYVRLVACVHDEIVIEVPEMYSKSASDLLSACMFKACKFYLPNVYIPPVDVEIASYWKKG